MHNYCHNGYNKGNCIINYFAGDIETIPITAKVKTNATMARIKVIASIVRELVRVQIITAIDEKSAIVSLVRENYCNSSKLY